MTDVRPDPEALLADLHEADRRARRGHLKIFFGMCPGVGKTYAMLRAAGQLHAGGVNVLVGLVETHGRQETEALLTGLPILPRQPVAHREAVLTELDLEGLLAANPRLAVVDELAHTNAPGSRHAKRWQDIVELVDAGIDVYTTLNIQHVESRADAVRQITGATVRETVPDSVLDLADEIELVDLTPEQLLQRLRAGKVYSGERADAAQRNFFQETHLVALRELALRYTAERVDRQLRSLRSSAVKEAVWRSGERLLVAVAASPFSTQLVRWTRRLAASQGASWIAAHVEPEVALTAPQQELLDRNLALARELGAEIVVTHDSDIARALVRLALQYNATQIVVGKPRAPYWREVLRGGTIVDRLLRWGGNIDIYVVPSEPTGRPARRFVLDPALRSPLKEYGWAAGVVAAITVIGKSLPPDTYLAAGMAYMLAVIALSLRLGRWPVFLAGVLSALTWNFLYIPPHYTLTINRVEDATLFIAYFIVSIIVGQLTARIRAQANNERMREERATALYQLTQRLSVASTLDDAVFGALRQIDEGFGAKSALLLRTDSGDLVTHFASSAKVSERERGVADWCGRNLRPAGRFTATLPSAEGFHLPLFREKTTLGVLVIIPPPGRALTLQQRDLLEAFARQVALAIERDQLQAASAREQLLAESEKLHRTLLDSVSHELRTPLAVISGVMEQLERADAGTRQRLIDEVGVAARRLNRLVGNLLDQTRLESGALRARMDWCDVQDLLNAALEGARDALSNHPVQVEIQPDLPPIRADVSLTEQALVNLLLNASLHTPTGTQVYVTAGLERGSSRVFFTIADRGPGFPGEMKERLFKKFARGDAARAGGLGLGLSIVRGFVAAQGGEIVVGEHPGGGAVFTIYLPHSKVETAPDHG